MAKKFAAIDGLHNIFNRKVVEGNPTNEYDLTAFLDTSENALVNHNTICFISVDSEDVGRTIGNHLIKEDDRFIIVQNDVFSLYGSLQVEPDPEVQTWRPIFVNGEVVIPEEAINSASLNFVDSEYLVAIGDYNVSTETLAIKYDIDEEKITEFVRSLLPEIPGFPKDGKLKFETPKETVHTDENYVSRDIEIEQNTIEVKSVIENTQSSTPSEQENSETQEAPAEIEGNFSADTGDNIKVKIHYKGTADRVDWYVEDEQRDEDEPNNSTAKKFLYIECLQDYFEPSLNFPYLKIREDKKHIICEDSIVFITCGSVQKQTEQGIFEFTDAQTFKNPEYEPGARFIWTHNKMFSANTWMPIFTRETEYSDLKEITPVIGTNSFGGRLIFQGKGGIIVDNTINDNNSTGEHDRIITIDGTGIGGEGGRRVWTTDVFVARDIPIGGTHLGDQVLLDGIFADCGNVVPANMTLHEVLYRLLYGEGRELWPTATPSFNLSITNAVPTIGAVRQDTGTNITSGVQLDAGTRIKLTPAKPCNATQAVSITGYLSNNGGGYKVDNDPIVVQDTFTRNNFTPVTTKDNAVTDADIASISGFTLVERTANYVILEVTGAGGTVNKITFSNHATAQSEAFTPFTIYPVSSKGNVDHLSHPGIIVKPEKFTNAEVNKSTTFQVIVTTQIIPYYIGAVRDFEDVHDFSTESGNHGQFITSHIGSGATESIKFVQYSSNVPATIASINPNSILGSSESRQVIVAVPASQFSSNDWLNSVTDALGGDWTNIDNVSFKAAKNTISINGVTYYVYTISAKKATKSFTNASAYTVNTKNRIS